MNKPSKSYVALHIDDDGKLQACLAIELEDDSDTKIGSFTTAPKKEILFIDRNGSLIKSRWFEIGLEGYTAQAASSFIEKSLADLPEEKHEKIKEILTATRAKTTYVKMTEEISKPEIWEYINEIIESSQGAFDEALSFISTTTFVKENDIDFNKYAFKKHIMLVGPKGSSKTHGMWQYALSLENVNIIDQDMNEGLEASDLLGMLIPTKDGTLEWMDGSLSEAFRKASKGEKVILIYDEILRMPQRELSILVGSLVPKNGKLRLRTNRMISSGDGMYVTEILECDPSNLWVMAASNIGAGYSVDSMDEAFADRFRIFRRSSTIELVKHIVFEYFKPKSFSDGLRKAMVQLWEDFQNLKASGKLNREFSIRHISEVLGMAEEDKDVFSLLTDLEYTVLSINSSGMVNDHERALWGGLIERFRV